MVPDSKTLTSSSAVPSTQAHYGPEQPTIGTFKYYWATRSFVRLLHSFTCCASTLRCAHSFARHTFSFPCWAYKLHCARSFARRTYSFACFTRASAALIHSLALLTHSRARRTSNGIHAVTSQAVLNHSVYLTGKDTKMILNSNIKSNKFSTAERSMNKFLFFLLSYLAVEAGFSTLLQVC